MYEWVMGESNVGKSTEKLETPTHSAESQYSLGSWNTTTSSTTLNTTFNDTAAKPVTGGRVTKQGAIGRVKKIFKSWKTNRK